MLKLSVDMAVVTGSKSGECCGMFWDFICPEMLDALKSQKMPNHKKT